MARRNETVWCGIFDDIQMTGLAMKPVKLNGAPIYVYQLRAQPPEKWVAKVLRRNVEGLVFGDHAELVKAKVEHMCLTKVTDWQEGYWDDDIWMPKTTRLAPPCAFKGPDPEPQPIITAIRGRRRKEARA